MWRESGITQRLTGQGTTDASWSESSGDADRSLQSELWEQPARENYLMLYLQLMDQSIMYQGTLCFHALGHNSLSPPDSSVTHVQDYPMIGNATEQA